MKFFDTHLAYCPADCPGDPVCGRTEKGQEAMYALWEPARLRVETVLNDFFDQQVLVQNWGKDQFEQFIWALVKAAKGVKDS